MRYDGDKAGNFKDSLPVRPAYPLVNWPKSRGVGRGELRSPASVHVHTGLLFSLERGLGIENRQFPEPALDLGPTAMNTQQIKEKGEGAPWRKNREKRTQSRGCQEERS